MVKVTRESDTCERSPFGAGTNSGDEEDFGTEDFPNEDAPDEAYVLNRGLRVPGGLDRTMIPKLKVAAMKVARAFGRALPASPVSYAPLSAATRIGRMHLVLSVYREGWRARVGQGVIGFDKTHMAAEGATPAKALDALVAAAQARGRAFLAKGKVNRAAAR